MAPAPSPLAIEERKIDTPRGPRGALVISPIQPVILGAARLAELRDDLRRAPIDHQIAREIRRRTGRVEIMIFRGVGPAGATWRFDEALGDDDADELGYLLTRSQLPTWRALVANGVHLHLHTDWGVRETAACRRGAARLRQELAADGAVRSVERFDAYMLSYLSLFYSADLDHVLGELLPSQLGLIEQRAARVRSFLEGLPRDAIG